MNPILIHAFSTALPAELPDEIQFMPPGDHTIKAFRSDGKTIDTTVHVTEKTAAVLQKSLESLDKPYLDFNHEDAEASGHVMAFRWGGSDPVTGGVRAKVEWTTPGKAALQGKAYRKFSPSFLQNANGEVVGAPLNMGGLVNKPAFTNITPIWAKSSDKPIDQEKEIKMETKTELTELQTANSDLKREITEIKAKLADAKNDQTIKAKDDEIAFLKAQNAALKTESQEQIKILAKSAVADAVRAGKVPSQNTAMQTHFETMYCANPGAVKEILAGLPVNPALLTVINASHAGGATGPGSGSEHEFLVKAKETSEAKKIPMYEAFGAVAAQYPAIYEDYRAKNASKK